MAAAVAAGTRLLYAMDSTGVTLEDLARSGRCIAIAAAQMNAEATGEDPDALGDMYASCTALAEKNGWDQLTSNDQGPITTPETIGKLGACEEMKSSMNDAQYQTCLQAAEQVSPAEIAKAGRCDSWPGLSTSSRECCRRGGGECGERGTPLSVDISAGAGGGGDNSGGGATTTGVQGTQDSQPANLVEMGRDGQCETLSDETDRSLCRTHYENYYGAGTYPRDGQNPHFVVRSSQKRNADQESLEDIARQGQCDARRDASVDGKPALNSGGFHRDTLWQTCKKLQPAADRSLPDEGVPT